MLRLIAPGTADVSVVIRIVDSTTGQPETGVTVAGSAPDLQYRREGRGAGEHKASVEITETDIAITDDHTDGGFIHIGNGYYRLDLPDAACATGASGVLIHGLVTNMVVIGTYIDLNTPAALFYSALTESFSTQGTEGTLAQLLYEIRSAVLDFEISGTVMTTKDTAGANAMTFTLDSATNPTSRTRAT